jgi:uncharacterized protein (DUF302 family)
MSIATFDVTHVTLLVAKPFEEFKVALEKQLGRFDERALVDFAADGDVQKAHERLAAMPGSSGFMVFLTNNHGAVLQLVGQRRRAIQYILGNPLFAVEMTRHAVGAALYAPLRLLIYDTPDGQTGVEYDLAASLFGQFGNAEIDRMAESLDEKMAAMVENAAR